jgi:serine/threonine protein kinase
MSSDRTAGSPPPGGPRADEASEQPTRIRSSEALAAALEQATAEPAPEEAAKPAPWDGIEERRAPPAEETVLELDDADEVVESHGGRRVSLSALVGLSPVGRYGKFDLLGRIAYGGMAEIFLARELQDGRAGRFVVVKRVLPHVANDRTFVDMFTDEARLVMQLSHPNICHVYSYGREEGAPFISMEWVNGMPLSRVQRRAKSRGGLSVPLALKIVAQVADALDHAHRAVDQSTGEPLGIVHRDVSPQNVMVSFDGVVKLLDFGIAKAASHSTRTEAGTIKGKFAYMAPEQCLGEPLDARADVFALGIVLLELLAGHHPFKKQTEFDTMRALVYEAAPAPSALAAGISPRLDAIVRQATAKRRDERFQSATEVGLALEQELARMGEVVTTARIGERMNELFREEIKAGPRLDTRIQVPPAKEGTSEAEVPQPVLPSNATEQVAAMPAMPPATPGDATEVSVARARSAPPRAGWLLAALLVIGALVAALAVALRPAPTPPAPEPPAAAPEPPPIEAVPVPAVTTGTLFLDSTPPGARVTLGDRGAVGTTPLELGLLDAGEWSVRLELEGHEPWDRTVVLGAGERVRLIGELTPSPRRPAAARERPVEEARDEAPAAPPGRLSLNTRPWSRVYLGGRLLGTTPLGDVEVPSGSARLRLVDRDGVEHSRTVSVPAGGHAREFFDLASEGGAP